MRLFVQRALEGSVTVDGQVISSIQQGLVCLVGIHRDDTDADADRLVAKLFSFRFWDGEAGPYTQTVADTNPEILLVSQFTLYARTCSGRRPDFSRSMGNTEAGEAFNKFVDKVKARYDPEKIKLGSFGADMGVRIVNDGPTTFVFDSANQAQ
jgi:D-tyrosyl-tRNA(Tyr) deacylase